MAKHEITTKTLSDGTKGINFDSWGGIENFLRETSTGAGGTAKPQLLRRVNPWLAKATDMTALAISQLPFDLVDENDVVFDSSANWKNKLVGIPSPKALLYTLASSLCLGKAYIIPSVTSRAITNLHYCAPHTTVPLITVQGLQCFSRTSDFGHSGTYYPAKNYGEDLPVKHASYSYSFSDYTEQYTIKTANIDVPAGKFTGEMIYFWLPDSDVELGPAKSYPASTALLPAELITAMDGTLQVIADRGFVPPTLLAVKGMTDKGVRAETEAWYNRFLRRWNDTVAKLINAETMDIKTLGAGMADLKAIYTEIKKQAIEDIAASYGIPSAIFMSDMAFATEVNPMIKVWYSTSIFMRIYQCIEDTLNAQLFYRFGLRLKFRPNELDAFQEDETKRASAFREYVSTDMRPSIAAEMLGLDLPGDMEYAALDEFYEKRLAGLSDAKPVNPISDPAVAVNDTNEVKPIEAVPAVPTALAKKIISLNAAEIQDLNLWRQTAVRFHEKSKPLPIDWECKSLPETIAAPIRGRLAGAQTMGDVLAAFDVGVTIDSTDAIMALADAINKAANV